MPDQCQFSVNINNFTQDHQTLQWILDNLQCAGITDDQTRLAAFVQAWGGIIVDLSVDGLSLWLTFQVSGQLPPALMALLQLQMDAAQDRDIEMQDMQNPGNGVHYVAFDGQNGVPIARQPDDNRWWQYLTIFACNFYTIRSVPPVTFFKEWAKDGLNNLSAAANHIRDGTSQMSVITVVNHTNMVLRMTDSYCYKGEATTTFAELPPCNQFEGGTMVATGMWSSTSQNTTGSASAIELTVKDGGEPSDKVVVAAADPIIGRNTYLVRVNESDAKDLADENDTAGNGNDSTAPWSSKLPKSQIQLDARVEATDNTFKKYCHVIIIFSQPGVVVKV